MLRSFVHLSHSDIDLHTLCAYNCRFSILIGIMNRYHPQSTFHLLPGDSCGLQEAKREVKLWLVCFK